MRVENATKVFSGGGADGVVALEALSLHVRDGEFVSIVGPSGCGKSTLLRILGKLESLTSGRITLRHDDERKPIDTILFQDSAVFPWMTVRANVEYGLRRRKVRAEDRLRIVDEFLAKVGLMRFADSYPYQLSGGMKQRVSIARTFVNDPEILLMDEPFAALDEPNRVLQQEELLSIWASDRKTVLFITHNLEEAIVLSDRVVVMTARPGRMKAEFDVPFGRPRAVYELKRQPRFGELAAKIWGELHDEVMRARADEEKASR
ncbi:MAG: ATP-binding cassette domain-containing protein [Propionibacteriales bacterium]|nr:ATP-binding cassette domain-containing protein [Propionibacteriales bacterium]